MPEPSVSSPHSEFDIVRKGISEPHRANNRYEYDSALRALRRIEEQLQAERREEWREGIVNVLDHEGNYLGCMGSETWAWTLDGGIERMKEQYQTALDRLWEAHDQLCGCDKPADEGRCSAPEETWGAFEYLGERERDSIPASERQS